MQQRSLPLDVLGADLRARCVQIEPPRRREDVVSRAEEALSSLPSRHRLLAVTGASSVTGELWPIEELCAMARRIRARVVVDAAQLAPHRRIDLAALGADWIAFSAHKLHAPFGCGALIGRADWLDAARPWLAGGGAVRRVSLDDVAWSQCPSRHEAGTPNLPGAVAFAAACRALRQILARGLRWRYARVDGRFAPDPDPRPQSDLGFGEAAGAGAPPCKSSAA